MIADRAEFIHRYAIIIHYTLRIDDYADYSLKIELHLPLLQII